MAYKEHQKRKERVKGEKRLKRERDALLKSWSCSHINCEIPTSNPAPTSVHPLHPLAYGSPPQGRLHKNLFHNPDKLSPGPSSLEKYIENLF
jgi:hypothetical protein